MPALIATFVIGIVLLLTSSRCDARGPCGHSGHASPNAGHMYTIPHPTHGGYAVPSPKASYAYGWFGVQPRQHKSVHHGYYNNYTQWSYR